MNTLSLGPRALQRLERREEILSLALATVVERGVDSLSMNKLAREIGFTPGALYRYFDSKDALISEIALRVLDDLIGSLLEANEAHREAPPLDRLQALVDAYVRFSRDDPHAFGFLSLLTAHPQVLLSSEEHVAAITERLQYMVVPVLEALVQAEAQGDLAPGESFERALGLFAALQGALQLRKQQRHQALGIDAERLAAHLVRTLLLGWGASGARS